jgi:CRP-like cAMP-binding protein
MSSDCLYLVRSLHRRFREVSTEKPVTRLTRLSLTLLRLLKQIGNAVEEGIEVSLARAELAQMTGTTVFSISRITPKWGKIGLVLSRRESVVILARCNSHWSVTTSIRIKIRPE